MKSFQGIKELISLSESTIRDSFFAFVLKSLPFNDSVLLGNKIDSQIVSDLFWFG